MCDNESHLCETHGYKCTSHQQDLRAFHISDDSREEYDSGSHKGQCWKIPKMSMPKELQEYFETLEWKQVIYWDDVLYKTANRSLDITIDNLGRAEFERNLVMFRKAQQQLAEACFAKVVLPCNTTGPPIPAEQTDCIVRDSGCGFDCMDAFFQQWDAQQVF